MTTIDTRKRAQVRAAYTKGMPVPEILERFDICRSTLYNWLKPGKRRGKIARVYTKGVKDAIATLNYRGYSDRRIARTLGLGHVRVTEQRKAMGLPEIKRQDRV